MLRLEDLAQAPFTTKAEPRDSQMAHLPLGGHIGADLADVIRIRSSSGTTGRASYMEVTRRDREIWTEIIRSSSASLRCPPAALSARPLGLAPFPR